MLWSRGEVKFSGKENMASEVAGSVAEPVQCPVCFKDFAASEINAHLDRCLLNIDSCPTSTSKDENGPPLKKPRISSEASSPTVNTTDSSEARKGTTPPSPVFSMFQTNRNKGPLQSERNTFLSNKPIASTAVSKGMKRHSPDEMGAGQAMGQFGIDPPVSNTLIKTPRDTTPVRALLNIDKPLAEKLRPTTLEEYFGQNKVVGEHTLLRSLLDSQEIPSLILWGPPGCGKVWCSTL